MTVSAPSYQLSLLGEFRLTYGGCVVDPRGPGSRLLALLALRGHRRPVSRSVICARLWSDQGARSAARLRSALWRLPRDRADPLVVQTATTLRLGDGVEVDLWSAEALAQRLARPVADLEPAEQDSTAFTEDLLPEWPEEWLVTDRESFRQTRLHALEHASDRLCRDGQFAAALQMGLRAVACEPLRETAHRRVIEAHLAEGNPAEALRHYQSFRRLLAAELGLVPTAALRRVVSPLLGRPVDSHRPPEQWPRPTGLVHSDGHGRTANCRCT